MNVLGLDIGGANTKGALISFEDNKIKKSSSHIEYFPFWEKTLNQIPLMLNQIINNITKKHQIELKKIDHVGITITAELSDAFQTKREGIIKILNALENVFEKAKMRFISHEIKFITFEEAMNHPLSIAAANWISTALFLGKFVSQCILIDAGSTTIDVIPIKKSLPVAIGKNDISRMIHHELIYTGGLRATIPSITHHVPYKNTMVRISFEKFALISDIHRVLNHISEEEYINDTADNRSKSIEDCYARIARTICMDLESITKNDLDRIAQYIYEKQLIIISRELEAFLMELIQRIPSFEDDPLFILTGLSSNFLIKPVLEKMELKNFESYEKSTHISDKVSSSALAVAGALYFQLME